MSVSKEEKDQKQRQRQALRDKQAQADRRSMLLYSTVAIVVAVAAIVMLVLNSGILQRSLTAARVGQQEFNAVEMQYYFNSVKAQAIQNANDTFGASPFDVNTSLKKQVYDKQSGQSWYDFLCQQALDALARDVALADKATQEGYVLSEQAQQELDKFTAQLDTAWISARASSRAQFIRATYGPHMTYELLCSMIERETLANDYARAQVDSIVHPESDFDAYYQENKTQLDTFSYDQFTLLAQVESTDAEGNALPEEEVAAALETEKAKQQALAQELQDKLEAGEDPQALALEYKDALVNSSTQRTSTGANLSYSIYADWILDESRSAGDVTLADYSASSSSHYFYVVQFHDRQLDQSATSDVRHILVAAQQDEGADQPTQAQYDAAKAEAEALLEQWQSGGATEEAFAALAEEHSADTGSAANGGLIQHISTSSGYVDTFKDWAMDPSRQSGDTGIVQNTGSQVKGWHIMYYVTSGDPVWKLSAADELYRQDLEQFSADAIKDVERSMGAGMKLVQD